MLDDIKAQGYKYSTKGAITVAVCDAVIPPQKKEIIAKAEEEVDVIRDEYMMVFVPTRSVTTKFSASGRRLLMT